MYGLSSYKISGYDSNLINVYIPTYSISCKNYLNEYGIFTLTCEVCYLHFLFGQLKYYITSLYSEIKPQNLHTYV